MAVFNVPPDGNIYQVGAVPGTLHIYNVGQPNNPATTYNLTILHVNNWMGVHLAAGHTNSYPANGNVVYIQNLGPSRIQSLYAEVERSAEDAGWPVVAQMPALQETSR